jgi:photosystem II stability/assembly factor-like uncharacterized protein
MSWTFIGGRPVTSEYWSGNNDAGGRVVSIACHPTSAGTAYIATASGGIWKTTDTGANWAPMTDNSSNLNHGAVEVDRNFPTAVYAGGGEYTTGSTGNGLQRSLDSGVTWSALGSAATLGDQCSGIAVVPGASANAPAAIHWTGSAGYRRSTTGGLSWSATVISGSCSSLAVDRSNPLRVFVAVHGSGIRRSVNGGATFSVLSGGLPTSGISRIVLSMSQSNPQVLYAAFANNSSGLEGLYRTSDGGDTWTKLVNTPNFPTPQAWYDLSVGVDPLNENHVFCGGVSPVYQVAGVIETTNGGQSWTEISGSGGQIHPDQHWVAFGADNVPWFGCDGGVWRRVGNTWSNRNATLAAIQNYTIAQHPADPNRVIAGTQDNGMAGTSNGSLAWPQITAGDGGYGAHDASVFNRLYTTYVYLRIYRVTGNNVDDITGPWSDDNREWVAPMVADANTSSWLYGGTNRVWLTQNAPSAAAWNAMSDSSVADGGTVSTMASVPGMPGVFWVANSNGGVWRTVNGGAKWVRMRTNDGTRITTVCPKPGSASEAFISRLRSTGTRVLQMTDGTTWTNRTGSLPSGARPQTLAVDWGRPVPSMYVGTGAGVYASFDLGSAWVKDGSDLPNVNIGQLEIDPIVRTIAAGTYGRGAWRSGLPKPADLNADGLVDGADLGLLLGQWGVCAAPGTCSGDLNGNGVIDGADLGALLGAWGN